MHRGPIWIKADGKQVETVLGTRLDNPPKTFCLHIKLLTFKLTTELSIDCLNDLLCCSCFQLLSTRQFPQAAPQVIHHDQSSHK